MYDDSGPRHRPGDSSVRAGGCAVLTEGFNAAYLCTQGPERSGSAEASEGEMSKCVQSERRPARCLIRGGYRDSSLRG